MPWLFYLLAVISIVKQYSLLMLYSNVQQDEIRENKTSYMAVDEDARMQNMGTPDDGFHEKLCPWIKCLSLKVVKLPLIERH